MKLPNDQSLTTNLHQNLFLVQMKFLIFYQQKKLKISITLSTQDSFILTINIPEMNAVYQN